MEFVRVEVRIIQEGQLPPIILPRTGGHRRVYTHQFAGIWYSINVMCIGDTADGITFGEADFAISTETPEKYFELFTPMFIAIAQERWVNGSGAFLMTINPAGPKLLDVLEAQGKLKKSTNVF